MRGLDRKDEGLGKDKGFEREGSAKAAKDNKGRCKRSVLDG